jgi:hypothetical protein
MIMSATATLSPPEEFAYMTAARSEKVSDASKLSFPLQLVILIIGAFGAMWASTYGMRSDIRDVLTRMEMQARIDVADAKAREAQAAAIEKTIEGLKESITAMQRQQAVHNYEITALKEAIIKQGVRR